MSKDLFIVQENQRPAWLKYPHSFCRLVEQGLVHLTPWHIMEAERALVHARGLAERYPGRELFPFAYRQDNDDVACWSSGAGKKCSSSTTLLPQAGKTKPSSTMYGRGSVQPLMKRLNGTDVLTTRG